MLTSFSQSHSERRKVARTVRLRVTLRLHLNPSFDNLEETPKFHNEGKLYFMVHFFGVHILKIGLGYD